MARLLNRFQPQPQGRILKHAVPQPNAEGMSCNANTDDYTRGMFKRKDVNTTKHSPRFTCAECGFINKNKKGYMAYHFLSLLTACDYTSQTSF